MKTIITIFFILLTFKTYGGITSDCKVPSTELSESFATGKSAEKYFKAASEKCKYREIKATDGLYDGFYHRLLSFYTERSNKGDKFQSHYLCHQVLDAKKENPNTFCFYLGTVEVD